jgi:hypothetical protein
LEFSNIHKLVSKFAFEESNKGLEKRKKGLEFSEIPEEESKLTKLIL